MKILKILFYTFHLVDYENKNFKYRLTLTNGYC